VCVDCPAQSLSAAAATAPSPAPARKPSTPLQIAGLVACALALIPVVVWAFSRSQGDIAYAIGQEVARFSIPAILVTLYYRKKNASSARIGIVVIAWVLFVHLAVLGQKPLLTEKDIPVIMREAVGSSPLPAHDSPDRAAIRDLFRSLLQRSHQYEADSARLEARPEAATVGEAPSFATLDAMEKALAYLRQSRQLDGAQVGVLDEFQADMARRVEGFDWPSDYKEGFLRGMRESTADQAPKKVARAKVKWTDSKIALYEFAIANHAAIHADMERISIPDPATLAGFNERVQAEEAARKELLAANAELVAFLQSAQQSIGISRKELGLKP
jgi:hypothetical protein